MTVSARPDGAARASGRLHGEGVITQHSSIWALRPRLHRNGAAIDGSLEVVATRPDGSVEPLLWLRDLGPDWQYAYELSDPVDLPPGSRIRLVAYAGDARPGAQADLEVAWRPGGAPDKPAEITDAAVAGPALRR
jgi:hypothetical protein